MRIHEAFPHTYPSYGMYRRLIIEAPTVQRIHDRIASPISHRGSTQHLGLRHESTTAAAQSFSINKDSRAIHSPGRIRTMKSISP